MTHPGPAAADVPATSAHLNDRKNRQAAGTDFGYAFLGNIHRSNPSVGYRANNSACLGPHGGSSSPHPLLPVLANKGPRCRGHNYRGRAHSAPRERRSRQCVLETHQRGVVGHSYTCKKIGDIAPVKVRIPHPKIACSLIIIIRLHGPIPRSTCEISIRF